MPQILAPNIKPLALFKAINGSQDQDAGNTVGGDIIKFQLYNNTDDLKTIASLDGIDGIIYDNTDSIYKTANKYFFEKIGTLGSVVLHEVTNGATVTPTRGVLNIIYNSADVTDLVNINLPNYHSTSDYEIYFYSQFTNVLYYDDGNLIGNSDGFFRAPKFTSAFERLSIKSYSTTPSGYFVDIKSVDEKHYFLGEISYIDINSADVSTEVLIPLSGAVPVGWYIERFVGHTTTSFSGPSYSFTSADILTLGSNMIFPTDKFIRSSQGNRISTNVIYDGGDIFDLPISDLNVRINWGSNDNPQNYIMGRFSVFAILKRMPLIYN